MSPADKPILGIGMVGYSFMGATHSVAWRTAHRVFDLPLRPRMAALVGRNAEAAQAAADNLGWESVETDWRALLERADIDLVDICTPGASHSEIAIAALEAGKHVLCEKPLANTVEEAERMVAAAEAAAAKGVRSMVAFNYRRVPATAYARQMIADGKLGKIRHVRAVYLQDWIVDPTFPLVWRLQKDRAGSGALGDIGAHIVDLAQYLTSDLITGVSAITETFVKERPLPSESAGLSASSSGQTEMGEVTVDDAALFLARFAGGALATFEATRFASGRKNQLRIEINGELGSLVFDMESMNELQYYDGTEPAATAGFRRILVTESDHPYMAAWWPPGHIIGYEHSFTHEIRDFVEAIGSGTDIYPSFADGLRVQRVLEAVETSSANNSTWQEIQA